MHMHIHMHRMHQVAVMSINGKHLSPHESTLGLVALAAKNEQLVIAATPRMGARGGKSGRHGT